MPISEEILNPNLRINTAQEELHHDIPISKASCLQASSFDKRVLA